MLLSSTIESESALYSVVLRGYDHAMRTQVKRTTAFYEKFKEMLQKPPVPEKPAETDKLHGIKIVKITKNEGKINLYPLFSDEKIAKKRLPLIVRFLQNLYPDESIDFDLLMQTLVHQGSLALVRYKTVYLEKIDLKDADLNLQYSHLIEHGFLKYFRCVAIWKGKSCLCCMDQRQIIALLGDAIFKELKNLKTKNKDAAIRRVSKDFHTPDWIASNHAGLKGSKKQKAVSNENITLLYLD